MSGKNATADVPHFSMYIDGEWVDTGASYEIRSSATDELEAAVGAPSRQASARCR